MAKKTKKPGAGELGRLKRELAAMRARYVDLYDLAPVGLFTLDSRGVVLEANLTVASMLGVEKDLKRAAEWYRKGVRLADPESQYCLGRLYEKGEGVAKDKQEALLLYRLAAAGGSEDAKKRLKELENER